MYSSSGSISDRYGDSSTTSGTPSPHVAHSRLQLLGRGRIDVDVDRAHVGRQRLRRSRSASTTARCTPLIGTSTVLWRARSRLPALQRQLRGDVRRSAAASPGRAATMHRDQQHDDPGAFERLRDRDDDQHDAGDERAEAVDRRRWSASPASRSRRQWTTMPACDSVNETNTPIM